MGEVKVFVGNVNFNANRRDLTLFFDDCQGVREVAIIEDRDTRRSKGYAFIFFANIDYAKDAVSRKDGQDFQGRPLKVKVADNQDNNRSFKSFEQEREKYDSYSRPGRGGGYGDSWHGGYGGGYRQSNDYGGGYGYGPERGGYEYGYRSYGGGDYRGSSAYYGREDRYHYSNSNGYNYY